MKTSINIYLVSDLTKTGLTMSNCQWRLLLATGCSTETNCWWHNNNIVLTKDISEINEQRVIAKKTTV